MKIARVRSGDGGTFVVSKDGAQWFSVAELGFDVSDTAGVIGVSEQLREALETGPTCQPLSSVDFVCPTVRPQKILGIGLNYMDHVRETGARPPDHVVVFAKFPNSLAGPFDQILLDSSVTQKCDYEVELAVIIGTRTKNVRREDAWDAVFGFAVANDVSARDLQQREVQFSRAKSMDTYCPIGPWITTADEVPDPQSLAIKSFVNEECRQDSSTSEMVYKIPDLIATCSRGMTLEPGDVMLTGTPHGVGFVMDPPRYLAAGDQVVCEIEGLGRIENRLAAVS